MERALRALFQETEQRLSRFGEDSELTQLNRRLGVWVDASPMLYEALLPAMKAWRKTGGTFDPRVAADLSRLGYGVAETGVALTPPHPTLWLERRPRTRRIRLWAPVDLGGVGKSLVVLWGGQLVMPMMREQQGGIPAMLINAGGACRCWAPPYPSRTAGLLELSILGGPMP